MDITINTWISVHEETERKIEHCLPCRSAAVSIDTAAQAEGVNSKTAFCISAQQFTSLSSTPAPSEKPRREPTPGFSVGSGAQTWTKGLNWVMFGEVVPCRSFSCLAQGVPHHTPCLPKHSPHCLGNWSCR